MSRTRLKRLAPWLVVLALLVALVSVAPGAEAGRKRNTRKGSKVSAASYSFALRVNKQFHTAGIINSTWPSDSDTFAVTCRDDMTLYVKIRDCCVTGDTICFVNENSILKACRRSPRVLVKYIRCAKGTTKTFGVAYSAVGKGGLPAGYDIWVVGLPR